MNKTLTFLAFPLLLTAAAQAQTTVLFEDFEDEALSAVPAIGGTNIGDSYANTNGAPFITANPEANGNTSATNYEFDWSNEEKQAYCRCSTHLRTTSCRPLQNNNVKLPHLRF